MQRILWELRTESEVDLARQLQEVSERLVRIEASFDRPTRSE
jgi:hypothetical protein